MRVKLQFLATAICLIGILMGVACKLWFPQYWFDLYPVILIAYWIIEMVMSFLIERYEGHMNQATLDGKKWLKTYMVTKFIKVVVCLALIIIGIKLLNDETHRLIFVGSSVVFYLLNLAAETYVLTKK